VPSQQQLEQSAAVSLPSESQLANYVQQENPHLSFDLTRYKVTYHPFPQATYEQQSEYLKKIISLCRAEHIHFIMINMPVTKENIDLLGTESYHSYLSNLKKTLATGGYPFIDMNAVEDFRSGKFCDSVHLNPVGAKMFMQQLINNLTSDNKLTVAQSSNDKGNTIDGLTTWWFTKAYYEKPIPPDAVILGDSHLSCLYGAYAYAYNKGIDITGNHRSQTIEENLKKLLHLDWRILIGALPKCMISDELMASHALFSAHYKPKLVVIMLSPSNFIDSTCQTGANSEAFSFFSKYLRLRQNRQSKSPSKLLEQLRRENYNFRPDYTAYMKPYSPMHLASPFERICPGQITLTSADGQSFTDDAEQYKIIYQNPMSSQFTKQLTALKSLFTYLSKQNIPAIAIEMPLTNSNHILLPESFWKYYRQRVSEICHQNNVDYWDVTSTWDDFPKTEFCDSAHLGLRGGLKLTRAIVLSTASKLRLPMYDYNGNFGPLVPGKEKDYFHKTWTDKTKSAPPG